ncbi:hypothetical protein HD597_005305 [Nonomuraea thailandensis]|uniref:Uncharacterized protein n=1 Tax=Nonomuraea thailandensis TaxID=1188745 RepID=A0A9X2K3L6_9ACTN|nr:hypothetical protein [Nonomuraea thailandensis]MCP2358285.1 hypothetical protein [Nonomuraea thailandensis]
MKKVARRRQRLTGRPTSGKDSRSGLQGHRPSAPEATVLDLGWQPPVLRLVPLVPAATLEQLALRHGLTGEDHVSVNGQWWTPEQFLALKWIPELCEDEVDRVREEIPARYGGKIPADLALLDISGAHFLGFTTWNEVGIECRAEHVTALAQTSDLREALGVLHRDGWITPMADGFLDAPGLVLRPVPPAPPHVRRWPTASHLHTRFRLAPLPADEIPDLAALLDACRFPWTAQGLYPVTGETWTPEQLGRHPWVQAAAHGRDLPTMRAYEQLVARHGDEIPADQAIVELSGVVSPHIVTGNFDVVDDEQLILSFAQADDLCQALTTLHRDGLLIPLANGLLLVPALAKTIDAT